MNNLMKWLIEHNPDAVVKNETTEPYLQVYDVREVKIPDGARKIIGWTYDETDHKVPYLQIYYKDEVVYAEIG